MKRSIIFLVCLGLAACSTQQQLNAKAEPMTKETITESASTTAESTFNIYESSKRYAWLDKGGEDGGLHLKRFRPSNSAFT